MKRSWHSSRIVCFFVINCIRDHQSSCYLQDRFWRKSRNENPGSSCIGTDLNRNYNVYWDGIVSLTHAHTFTLHNMFAHTYNLKKQLQFYCELTWHTLIHTHTHSTTLIHRQGDTLTDTHTLRPSFTDIPIHIHVQTVTYRLPDILTHIFILPTSSSPLQRTDRHRDMQQVWIRSYNLAWNKYPCCK